MKTEVHYICEICGYKSLNKKAVKECEAGGIPDISKYPIGLIYHNANRSSYKDITFAVAVIEIDSHFLNVGLYACRDNGYGDTLEDGHLCGSGHIDFYLDKDDVSDEKHPTFKRMVKALKKKGILITVWDGEKAVPYKA